LSLIYTHFKLQRVNVAVMLPCELAEENHEESDDSLRTKFVSSKISCAVDVACLRNPKNRPKLSRQQCSTSKQATTAAS
jgi:hypothetical protein